MVRLFLSFRCVGLKEWQQQQQQVRQQTQNNDKKHFDVEIREKQIVDEPEINQTTSLPLSTTHKIKSIWGEKTPNLSSIRGDVVVVVFVSWGLWIKVSFLFSISMCVSVLRSPSLKDYLTLFLCVCVCVCECVYEG